MEKSSESERGINLDELQQEAEKLLSLLKDRQMGLMSWNGCFCERLKSMHALTSRALGKPDHELSILRAEIDTDLDPRLPFNGASIKKHVRQGKVVIEKRVDGLYIGGQKVILWRSVRQINGRSVVGCELLKEADGQLILSASILDFLLANQEYIPEEWKEKDENGNTIFIFFWVTIYRDSYGYLCVRCLYWFEGACDESYDWLDRGWDASNPAAVCASN